MMLTVVGVREMAEAWWTSEVGCWVLEVFPLFISLSGTVTSLFTAPSSQSDNVLTCAWQQPEIGEEEKCQIAEKGIRVDMQHPCPCPTNHRLKVKLRPEEKLSFGKAS
uniref:UDP-N-acetylglucosamine 1-carboxyvinyltransferase n=1 Tax=Anthurium amnicola TaxID=1678845 RepID=A0A1D1XX04_9ARAE